MVNFFHSPTVFFIPICVYLCASAVPCSAFDVPRPSAHELEVIGRQIWMNECAGKLSGMTSWNKGENFASLGIGHFIWYPAEETKNFEEGFPKFIAFAESKGIKVPDFTKGACPWKNRDNFLTELESSRMQELRTFLESTISLQIAFIEDRLIHALSRITAQLQPHEKKLVEEKFQKVISTPGGFYPLIDYVNFKGEGTKLDERYQHQGWGLLQVLQKMDMEKEPLQEFAKAAAFVLKRRVAHAPPERHEEKWLPGWIKRCESYAKPLSGI